MAGKSTFNISLKLLDKNFRNGLNNIKRQLKGFGNFVKSAFSVASVTVFGRALVKASADFEDAMARVKAVSNASDKQFKNMRNAALKMGQTTIYSAEDAAGALENLTRNGLSATDATRALSGVLQLAQANAIGLQEAADIVTNTMNMFGLSVKDVNHNNDILCKTASTSATNVSLLYEALVNAAPAAHTLGFTLDETCAVLGALANRGVKGAAAGTQLRMALTKMADPKIVKKLNEMGVAINEQTMKEEGLIGTVKRLKDAHLSLSDLVSVFTQKGAVGIQQMINAYDDMVTEMDILENAEGTAQRMFEQGVGTTRKNIDLLKNTWNNLLIKLGNDTSNLINSIVIGCRNILNNFRSTWGTIINLVGPGVALLTKAITGAIRTCKNAAIAGLSAIKMAMPAVIEAIAWVVTLVGSQLYAAFDKIARPVREFKKEEGQLNSELSNTKTYAKKALQALGPETDNKTLAGITSRLCELMPDFASEIKKAYEEARNTKGVEIGTDALNKYKDAIDKVIQAQERLTKYEGAKLGETAYTGQLAAQLYQKRHDTGSGSRIFQEIKKQNLKGQHESIYANMAKYIVDSGDAKEAGKMISGYLAGMGIDIAEDIAEDFASRAMTGFGSYTQAAASKAAREQYEAEVDAYNVAKKRAELEAKAKDYNIKFSDKTSDEDLERLIQKYESKLNGGSGGDDGGSGSKGGKTVKDVADDLANTISDVNEDLEAGMIDNEDALKELTRAYVKAYEDFRELTRGTNQANPYKEKAVGLTKGEIGLRGGLGMTEEPHLPKIDAKSLLPKKPATYQDNSALKQPTAPGPLNLDGSALDKYIEKVDLINNGLSNTVNAVASIGDAWDKLSDDTASWQDKLQASMQIMSAMTEILETVNTLQKIGTALTAGQQAVEGELLSTKIAAAVASLFSGNGEIPIAGIAIALAGVGMMIAAIASSKSKFAGGGIVDSNSLHGDRNLVRVNGGEMILNPHQQANLFALLKNGAGGGGAGTVEFMISGKNLKGVLNNVNNANAKIKGNL